MYSAVETIYYGSGPDEQIEEQAALDFDERCRRAPLFGNRDVLHRCHQVFRAAMDEAYPHTLLHPQNSDGDEDFGLYGYFDHYTAGTMEIHRAYCAAYVFMRRDPFLYEDYWGRWRMLLDLHQVYKGLHQWEACFDMDIGRLMYMGAYASLEQIRGEYDI